MTITSMQRYLVGSFFVVLIHAGAIRLSAEDVKADLSQCPVRPGRPGLPNFQATYKGNTFHFCCDACLRAFNDNPRVFVKESPDPAGSSAQSPTEVVGIATDLLEQNQFLFGYLLAILLVLLVGLRARQIVARAKPGKPTPRILQRLTVCAHPTLLAYMIVIGGFVEIGRRYLDLQNQFRGAVQKQDELRSQVRERAELVELIKACSQNVPAAHKGLKKTYYRGNDEKGQELFRNGRYRTCSFLLSVKDAGGRALMPSQTVHGKIFLQLEIERARNTRDELFSEEILASHALFRRLSWETPPKFDSEPLRFKSVEPTQRWRAEAFLEEVPEGSSDSIERIYYLGGTDAGSRPEGTHYIILLKIVIEAGRLSGESDLLMMELVKTDSFGLDPIPEVPDGWKLPMKTVETP